MHSARALTIASFSVERDGQPVTIPDLFPGFYERDRLGVVVRHPGGALGASVLILATITAFYDIHRAHRARLMETGRPVEHYRRVGLDTARTLLASASGEAAPA